MVGAAGGRNGGSGRSIQRRLADHRHFQITASDPEIAQGFDIAVDATDLRPGISEQVENANQHAVVAEHVLVRNPLVEGDHLVTVMAGNVVIGSVGVIGLTIGFAGEGFDLDIANKYQADE